MRYGILQVSFAERMQKECRKNAERKCYDGADLASIFKGIA